MSSDKNFVTSMAAILAEHKIMSAKEAQSLVLNFSNQSDITFDEFVISQGLVSKEDMLNVLSEYYQVPAVDVRGLFFDIGLVKSMPKEFLLHYGILPMEVDQDIMTVVAYRPDIPGLESKLEEYGSYVIEFRVGLWSDIVDVINECYEEPILTEQDMSADDAEELIEAEDIDLISDEQSI